MSAMEPVRQFRAKHGYKYTKQYHSTMLPSKECSAAVAASLVKNFNVAVGALAKKETRASPVGPADTARKHLVTCILHRIITRTRLTNRNPNLGHEHQLRLLLGHLKKINDTLAGMDRANVNNTYWRAVEKALAPVVYQTPDGRNSLHPTANNIAKYKSFIMKSTPRSIMINQAATCPPGGCTSTTTYTPRRGAGSRVR